MKDVNNSVEFTIMFLIGIWSVGLAGLRAKGVQGFRALGDESCTLLYCCRCHRGDQ